MDLDLQGLTTAFNRIVYLNDASLSQKRYLLDKVMELAAVRKLKQLDSLALGQILWAYGKCKHSPQQTYLNKLMELVLERKDEFDGQTFSNIFYGFAFMPKGSMALFSELAPTVADRLHEFEPRYIASLAWACATVGFDEQYFLFSVSQATTDKLGSFSPHDIANVIWAFAKLNFVDRTLLDNIANVALMKADQFEPLAISSTLISFAHLNRRDDVFFDMMAEVARRRVKEFGTQSLSNVIFAYAKMGYRNVELMNDFSNRAIEIIDEVEPQVLSTLAWAHGELNVDNQKLFDAINQEARKRLHEFDSHALSQLMWGVAKRGCVDQQLFEKVHAMVMPKIGTYKPNEIANLMWAFSKAGIYDSKLYTLGLEVSLQQKFGAKSIANLMDAIATSRHYDNATCTRFARSIEKKIDMYTADTVASILASLAQLGYNEKFAYEHVAYSYMLPDTFTYNTHQNVTNICFSMAFAGFWLPAFWEKISEEFKKLKSQGFTNQQLKQLAIVQLASDIEGGRVFELPHRLSINCYTALTEQKREIPSQLLDEVLKCLNQCGYQYQQNKMIEDELYADITLVHKQDGKVYNVALFVCGPECFSQNAVFHPNGETQLLQRLVMFRGWKTGLIAQHRWNGLHSTSDKVKYIKDKVRKTVQFSHHGRSSGDSKPRDDSQRNQLDQELFL